MRYSPDHKDKSRDKIVASAARLLRRDGIDGVSIATVMKDAGLTHGAFYAHFASKDDMVAEALRFGFDTSRRATGRRVEAAEAGASSPLRALIESYLSREHIEMPWRGCPIATLAQEVSRNGNSAPRQAMGEGLKSMVENFARFVPGDTPEAKRARATMICTTLIGTLTAARVLEQPEEQLAFLDASREALLESCEAL